MSGLVRIAILVASVMVAVNSPAIVGATSASQIIRQQQRSTLKDLSSLTITKPLGDSSEQHQFRKINARMAETIAKRQTSPRSTNNNHLRLSATTKEEKKRSVRSTKIRQSSKAPQTYTKRVFFGFLPSRRKLRPKLQSGYGSQTIVDLAGEEGGHLPSGTTNFDDTGEFSQSSSFSEKRELEPACFPFCFPRYNGKRGMYGSQVEEAYPNADSSHGFTTEPKESQRRCFPFCLPQYGRKRTIDEMEQLAEAKENESKRDFEEKRIQRRTAGIFAEDKRSASLLDKPVGQVRRLYRRSPLHREGYSGATSVKSKQNLIKRKD